jgi:hypothetical protein
VKRQRHTPHLHLFEGAVFLFSGQRARASQGETMLFNRPQFMYSPDDNGGGTADSGDGQKKSSNDPETGFKNLVERQGGYDATALLLYS